MEVHYEREERETGLWALRAWKYLQIRNGGFNKTTEKEQSVTQAKPGKLGKGNILAVNASDRSDNRSDFNCLWPGVASRGNQRRIRDSTYSDSTWELFLPQGAEKGDDSLKRVEPNKKVR